MSHWSQELDELKGTELECIDEVDKGWDYGFDIEAIVKNEKGYHVVRSSGCSCPSVEEVASYCSGPFDTYEEALTHISDSHRSDFRKE